MRQLVFDLGFHRGEDTAYYLAMGYAVVAVDASAALVAEGRERFAEALASGQLTLLQAAVVSDAQRCEQPQVAFYPHAERSEWGTVDPRWVERNSRLHGLPHAEPVWVEAVSLPQLVQRFGCPEHLKIDIEGLDSAVLADLALLPEQPRSVSWETGKDSLGQVWRQHSQLARLGYSRFRVMQQARQPERPPARLPDGSPWQFPAGSSGPLPLHSRQSWHGLAWVKGQYLLLFGLYRLFGPGSAWGHARRSSRHWLSWLPRWCDRHLALPGWYDSHAWHR